MYGPRTVTQMHTYVYRHCLQGVWVPIYFTKESMPTFLCIRIVLLWGMGCGEEKLNE